MKSRELCFRLPLFEKLDQDVLDKGGSNRGRDGDHFVADLGKHHVPIYPVSSDAHMSLFQPFSKFSIRHETKSQQEEKSGRNDSTAPPKKLRGPGEGDGGARSLVHSDAEPGSPNARAHRHAG